MMCVEYFYDYEIAQRFMKNLHRGANPEFVETVDEDTDEAVYIVYYVPPKMA